MKTTIKKLFYQITGKYNHIKIGVKYKNRWFGNKYGGFYAIQDLLNKDSIVYSFGIGEDISFDKAIIEEKGCTVFGFDPTPKSINWCKSQTLPKLFNFHEYGVSKSTGKVQFNLPNNNEHVSGSLILHKEVSKRYIDVEMKSFSEIVKLLNHSRIDLIKMDIEGSEYDVLDGILESNVIIDQIVIEFHERFFIDGKEKTIQAINKLNKKGYEIFAISNSYEEISFVNLNSIN